ncbi:zinc finger protein and BTB domain-containing protein, putative [Pediculus humanus corporis]|uniref:Zinc finger protein and BTB domain-containing protein, putative n=1 Tax=Pediculus humanus subsp. corporis TaxID=121224 RepID=E0VZN4_PEDHC|nr:zinc finger protein and BTB domain-containing protein, putative [Pediculus humanus corporis]EEB18840.1 zinc finger protein and BTB domain-containing protein, putative [Pediculus humanus corporis]
MQHVSGGEDSPQPPQQFCLRWNNYQSNLTNVFDQLLQSESFVDVTLACDGRSIKAHKMVLSACSPYFRQLFFENPCQHPIIILKDINWPELKATVEFMYKGEINVSQDQIGPLLKVAENLKIRGLTDVNGEESGDGKCQTMRKIGSGWDPKTSTLHTDESLEDARPSSPSPSHHHLNKKRRRKCSPERSSAGRNSVMSRESSSSPEISPGAPDSLEAVALDMSPPTPQTPVNLNLSNHVNSHPQNQHSPARPQSRGQPHSAPPHLAAEPPSLPLSMPPTVPPHLPVDDMEIKPGIAEMIREEERVSLFFLSLLLLLLFFFPFIFFFFFFCCPSDRRNSFVAIFFFFFTLYFTESVDILFFVFFCYEKKKNVIFGL